MNVLDCVLPLAPYGLGVVAVVLGRHVLDLVALAMVLRGSKPAERADLLREFGRWLPGRRGRRGTS